MNAPRAHGPKSAAAASLTAGGRTIIPQRGWSRSERAKPSAAVQDDAGSALVRSGLRRTTHVRFWRGSFKLSESSQCFYARIESPYVHDAVRSIGGQNVSDTGGSFETKSIQAETLRRIASAERGPCPSAARRMREVAWKSPPFARRIVRCEPGRFAVRCNAVR